MRRLLLMWHRLMFFFRRDKMDQELAEEMRLHLEMKAQEKRQAGMGEKEAQQAASREFGNPLLLKELSREMWGWNEVESIMKDIRYGLRMLAKNPGFTVVAVLVLALGLSANITIFSIFSLMYFQPLPVKEPDRLVMVLQRTADWQLPHGQSWPDYLDYKQRVAEFSDMLALLFTPAHLSVQGRQPDRTWIEAVSGNYFSMLGIEPAHGRLFLPGEGQKPGADPVIVLSYHYWQAKLGGDLAIIGQGIKLNGRPFTVLGITPPQFTSAQWALAPSAFIPATMVGQLLDGGGNMLENRGWGLFKVMARLAPGVTLEQAKAAVEIVSRQLVTGYPKEHYGSTTLVLPEMRCRPEPSFSDFMPFVAAVFMAMVCLVLFIACANVTTLMYSRAIVRQREMGIRSAIGASRWRLIRQLLAESMLLSFLAGVVGLVLARWSGAMLTALTPQNDIPVHPDPRWDWYAVAFTVLASLVAGMITGIAPALRATKLDVQTILKKSGGALLGSSRHPFRSGLVISQVALCLVVLVCGGLFVQSLRQMTTINLGFRSENLVMASLDLGLQGYQDKRGLQFHQQLTETVRALPGVKEVSMAGAVPFDNSFQFRDVSAEGQIASSGQADKESYIQAGLNRVDTHYLRTMGIMLLRGRDFTEQDDESAPKVAIINQTMAQRLWPQQDALGKRFRLGRDGDYVQVVGMVSTGKYVMLGEGPRPYLYVPLAQDYSSPATLHIRTASDPLALVPTIRRVLQTLDPDLPIYNVRTMQEHLRQSAFALMPLRMGAVLAGSQGLLGLLLAVMGIYGVVAYVVSQRSREIGIRMALGAQRLDVLKLVVRGGLKLTVIGMGIGLLVALAVVRLLSGLLYGLNPMSLTVFIAAMALLTGVAMLACYLPARHATKVNPVDALRQE